MANQETIHYLTTKNFLENLVVVEIDKINIGMNQPVYLDLSILDICKLAM